MTPPEIKRIVSECVTRLSEHCDSVRIFVTSPSNDGSGCTDDLSDGAGNFLAQRGQIRDWMLRQDEYVKEHAKRNVK